MIHPAAARYSVALYKMALDSEEAQSYLQQLRVVQGVFEKDLEIKRFFLSPAVQPKLKEKTLGDSFKDSGLAEAVKNFIFVLARRGRFYLFSDVIAHFQTMCDDINSVIRGEVRSSEPLGAEERENIQSTISRMIKKRVVLDYIEDPSVIGGLMAQVGGYIFDDTLFSHLNRLNEDLNRRFH